MNFAEALISKPDFLIHARMVQTYMAKSLGKAGKNNVSYK